MSETLEQKAIELAQLRERVKELEAYFGPPVVFTAPVSETEPTRQQLSEALEGCLNGNDAWGHAVLTLALEALDRRAELATETTERKGLTAEGLDAVWSMIVHSWSIETREFFEREGPIEFAGPPDATPLMKAIHHTWKRDPKVSPLVAELDQKQEHIKKLARIIDDLQANHADSQRQWEKQQAEIDRLRKVTGNPFTMPDEPQNWTIDAPHENGNYWCRCTHCGCTFCGHKRRVVCRVCASPQVEALEGKLRAVKILALKVRNATEGMEPSEVRMSLLFVLNQLDAILTPNTGAPTKAEGQLEEPR